MDEPTQELVNFDRVTWRGVQMPSTKKGYYSRGDVLEGVQPAKPRERFCDGGGRKCLAMGINNETNTWNSVPQPVREKSDEHDDTGDVIGVFPVGNKTVLIMRHQLLSFLVKHNQDFQSDTVVMDNGGWRSLRNDSQGGS